MTVTLFNNGAGRKRDKIITVLWKKASAGDANI